MIQGTARSPVHRIIATLWNAVDALGLGVPPLFVERWGVAVHQALSSRAREFHTHQHVLDLVSEADPLETLAALYHDIVYVQVDLGLPAHLTELLAPLLSREEAGYRLLPHCGEDPTARDVLAVFDHQPGELLTAYTGLNELASALVAGKEFEGVLSREQLLALSACIEATIPFRPELGAPLLARLQHLGVAPDDASVMVRRAVRLANNDVGNFAETDPARFLDNTWKLLPETNPTLHTPNTYGVRDYRVALMKMEGFLGHLPAERVFHVFGLEPAPETHRHRLEAAARNIPLAVRYLRSKLYSTAIVEALAEESGGDAPLDLFMGGLPEPGGPTMKRIEQFLPPMPRRADDLDPVMVRLLEGGRATPSSFDISPSPLASFLYCTFGERVVMEGVETARGWWKGQTSAREFLVAQPKPAVVGLAQAASQIADFRRELLLAVAVRHA